MTTPFRRSVAWVLLAVSGLTLALAWVLASPVGASPDEHSAYRVRMGERYRPDGPR